MFLKSGQVIVVNQKHLLTQPIGAVYVGRPTPLGNPFALPKVHTDQQRQDCIAKYRVWLLDKLQDTNSPQYKAFEELKAQFLRQKSLMLICWCRPLACHADVIRELLLEWWQPLSSSKSNAKENTFEIGCFVAVGSNPNNCWVIAEWPPLNGEVKLKRYKGEATLTVSIEKITPLVPQH
jgi:hypothetical protein